MQKAAIIAGIMVMSVAAACLADECCEEGNECHQGKECRMDRAAANSEPAFVMSASPVQHFQKWKKEFVNPSACRMALCAGSCSASGQGCTLSHKACK